MSLLVEDIYDWFKKYIPSKLEEDYDIDQLEEIYNSGIKYGVGKFKDGDIISYDWISNKESTLHTAVAIFKNHVINEYKFLNSINNYDFCFFTYIGSFDLYSEDSPNIMKGAKVVYKENIRIANEEEKLKFFDNLRKGYK
jgi:hypothetical protein